MLFYILPIMSQQAIKSRSKLTIITPSFVRNMEQKKRKSKETDPRFRKLPLGVKLCKDE